MTTLTIPDMGCGHCKATVEQTVRRVAPEARAEVDLAARTLATDAADLPAVIAALTEAGYPPAR